MALRVTQHTMYNNMVGHMQQNLSAYMESVQQGSSQKKINRPSDDPAGTYRVLTTRNDMVATAQYQENVDTATGWLNLADSVLSTNVATAITGLKTLAEQASTGTYTAQQRLIMADQARQYFGQLLNLSNTQFEDMHLFGGHKYDQSAFEQGLAATSWDENWNSAINNGFVKIEGDSERSVLVEFTEMDAGKPLQAGMKYKWSNDAGVTWNEDFVKLSVPASDGMLYYQLKPTGSGVTISIPVTIDPETGNPKYIKDEKGELVLDENDKEIPAVMVPNPDFKPEEKEDPDKNPKEIALSVIAAVGTEDDKEKETAGAKNGTFLYIRPAAFYQGDDKDPPVDVTLMGAGELENRRSPETGANPVQATGSFGANMLVRIDGTENKNNGQMENVDLFALTPQEFTWSYSTDGGASWVTAKGTTNGSGTLRLPVPGGYVDFDLTSKNPDGTTKMKEGRPVPLYNDGELRAGMQANIHPSRADLDYEILKDTWLSVNSVGKDVFGGYYEGKPAMSDNDYNLFEVVGSFIGYLEGNNQEGCQRTLAALTKAEEKILAEATRIGGMENRLEMASDVLSFQKLDQQERLSYTEDIDLTELLTKLTRQQLTYQTVLQSSSMIMQMSLANYV